MKRLPHNFKDISGCRFGRLLVVRREDQVLSSGLKTTRWRCVCDCGKERLCYPTGLIKGQVKSCKDKHCRRLAKYISNDDVAIKAIHTRYRLTAKKKGLTFDLDVSIFAKFITRPCCYCGSEPSNNENKYDRLQRDFLYNGIDRVDSSKGYIIGNIVPCCSTCNYMKRSMSNDDFINHIYKIARFNDGVGKEVSGM